MNLITDYFFIEVENLDNGSEALCKYVQGGNELTINIVKLYGSKSNFSWERFTYDSKWW